MAAVDLVLGCDEGGYDVSPFLRRGEVLGHHAGQEASAAVGGGDRDV